MARLPEELVQDVRFKGENYYNDNQWVRAFLYNARNYGVPVNPDILDQNDHSYMILIGTRFDSFKEKYAIHNFNDKEIVYAVTMMLSFNTDARVRAVRDAEVIVKSARGEK